MDWNIIMALGIGVSLGAAALGWGSRTASEASLGRRCRWAIRLSLGYGGVLFLGLLVSLARFAWSWADGASTVEERTLLLAVCMASAFNLVLGFLIFGMVPTLVAFKVARRLPQS